MRLLRIAGPVGVLAIGLVLGVASSDSATVSSHTVPFSGDPSQG